MVRRLGRKRKVKNVDRSVFADKDTLSKTPWLVKVSKTIVLRPFSEGRVYLSGVALSQGFL
jgi:hypothetical protein